MSESPKEGPASPRFEALDGVRACAMLLGVLYHALQFGGMRAGLGPGGMGGASLRLQEWMHSFRMPLFFLISGFFSRMMLEKYGVRSFLAKRWRRLGIPLLLGIFLVAPFYNAIRTGPGGMMGGPPRGGGTGGPPDFSKMPPPPAGFVPPPLARFDADGDGSLSAEEWEKVGEEMGGRGGPGGGPGRGGPPPMMMGGGGMFRLDYFWFLWYLLVFTTGTALVLGAIPRWLSGRGPAESADKRPRLLRYDLAPLILGLAAFPALMATPSFFGWGLGPAAGIFRSFPDFLYHLEADMPFYYLFFLGGWWLHLRRSGLPDVADAWVRNLAIGLVAHGLAVGLSSSFANRPQAEHYGLIRAAGYASYALGTAFTSFGVLGFFQKYLDRPTRIGRYLAETAFWVYFVHQPLLEPYLGAAAGLGLPWWIQGPLVALLTTGTALLLYEWLVRPTPLIRLFGPTASQRPRDDAI